MVNTDLKSSENQRWRAYQIYRDAARQRYQAVELWLECLKLTHQAFVKYERDITENNNNE